MFLGTFEPNLMEKGRLALPKKIREELGGKRVVLTIGLIVIYILDSIKMMLIIQIMVIFILT